MNSVIDNLIAYSWKFQVINFWMIYQSQWTVEFTSWLPTVEIFRSSDFEWFPKVNELWNLQVDWVQSKFSGHQILNDLRNLSQWTVEFTSWLSTIEIFGSSDFEWLSKANKQWNLQVDWVQSKFSGHQILIDLPKPMNSGIYKLIEYNWNFQVVGVWMIYQSQ